MRIFIDEAGTFLRNDKRPHAFSAVGGVIVPGRYMGRVETEFKAISKAWPRENAEIKGRLLGEEHVAALCKVLERFDVTFEAAVMDMNVVSDQEIQDHQRLQSELTTKNLTDQHAPLVREQVNKLKITLEKMPPQLYCQFMVLTRLVWRYRAA